MLLIHRLACLAHPLCASVMVLGVALISHSHMLAGPAASDSAAGQDFAAATPDDYDPPPPSPSLDRARVRFARQTYRCLLRAEAQQAVACSVGRYQLWQHRAVWAREHYHLEYQMVTPAGRLRAHLAPPDGDCVP